MFKNLLSFALMAVILTLSFTACKKDDDEPIAVTSEDLTVSTDENPANGTVLGEVPTNSNGTVSYTITTQSVSGAVAVDASTGEITVADRTAFDYETNTALTATIELSAEGATETATSTITVNINNVSPEIWTGADITFAKEANADWTLPANQDRITAKVVFTRQDDKAIYNYQWWQDNFGQDVSSDDLSGDFWDWEPEDLTLEFTPTGGTKGVKWAILDDTGFDPSWSSDFNLYGTLGDPTHFYSLHNIGSVFRVLGNGENVMSVVDNFTVEQEDGSTTTSTRMPELVGKKLACYIEDEDIYFTLTFTEWGNGEDNPGGPIAYTRSTL